MSKIFQSSFGHKILTELKNFLTENYYKTFTNQLKLIHLPTGCNSSVLHVVPANRLNRRPMGFASNKGGAIVNAYCTLYLGFIKLNFVESIESVKYFYKNSIRTYYHFCEAQKFYHCAWETENN